MSHCKYPFRGPAWPLVPRRLPAVVQPIQGLSSPSSRRAYALIHEGFSDPFHHIRGPVVVKWGWERGRHHVDLQHLLSRGTGSSGGRPRLWGTCWRRREISLPGERPVPGGFEPKMYEQALKRLKVGNDMRRAIEAEGRRVVVRSYAVGRLDRAVPLESSFCTDVKAQFREAYELDPYRCRYVPSVLKYLSRFT